MIPHHYQKKWSISRQFHLHSRFIFSHEGAFLADWTPWFTLPKNYLQLKTALCPRSLCPPFQGQQMHGVLLPRTLIDDTKNFIPFLEICITPSSLSPGKSELETGKHHIIRSCAGSWTIRRPNSTRTQPAWAQVAAWGRCVSTEWAADGALCEREG